MLAQVVFIPGEVLLIQVEGVAWSDEGLKSQIRGCAWYQELGSWWFIGEQTSIKEKNYTNRRRVV